MHEIAKLTPSKFGNNDQYFWSSGVFKIKFDYIKIVDEKGVINDRLEEMAWVYQLPDIVFNYYIDG